MADKLTPKQNMFVKEYLVDLNATQAYLRAGYNVKSEDVAAVNAKRLLSNAKIGIAIQAEMKDREKRTDITADNTLIEFAKLGFSDITNYLDIKTLLIKIGETEDGQPIYEKRDEIILKDFSTLTKYQTAAIESVKYGKYGLEFKLHDKKGALDSIARHLGMFDKDSLNVNMVKKLEDFF